MRMHEVGNTLSSGPISSCPSIVDRGALKLVYMSKTIIYCKYVFNEVPEMPPSGLLLFLLPRSPQTLYTQLLSKIMDCTSLFDQLLKLTAVTLSLGPT